MDGLLVQGSPCASYIAAAIFSSHERYVVRRLETKRYTYTRYVDDITISCKRREESYSFVIRLIDEMLHAKELERNQAKTKVLRRGSNHMLVHGIKIDVDKISLPDDEIKSIYSSLANLRRMHRNIFFRASINYRKIYTRCKGRVGKLKRIDDQRYNRCEDMISRLRPESSVEDLMMCRKWTEKLKKEAHRKKNHFHHLRAVNRTIYRVRILSQQYPVEASTLLDDLVPIQKNYDEISP